MTKPVVLILVEGVTDELVVSKIAEDLGPAQLMVSIYHGDPFSDFKNRKLSGSEVIHNCVNHFLNLQRLRPSDLVLVIHLTDTDGAFIPEEDYWIDALMKGSYRYDLDRQQVLFRNQSIQSSIIDTWQAKARFYQELAPQQMLFNRERIPYYLVYNALHQDHVIKNDIVQPGFKDDEALAFIDQYEDLEDYWAYFQSKCPGQDLADSWDQLRQRRDWARSKSSLYFVREILAEAGLLKE